ncbi:MAG TPA: SAM-dependent methyltransferase [Jatrophihabitans sp.]|jgi:SAM-dependent methyltransferase
MTERPDTAYLDGLYATSSDPWRLADSFYEQRKRAVVLSCLTRQRYRSVFEPACGSGELTIELAPRCETLLASDYHQRAVDAAGMRLAGRSSVSLVRMLVPEEWPNTGPFDLIVLSEFGYYLAPDRWRSLCAAVAGSLTEDGSVLACHWRHPFQERLADTASLHAELDRALDAERVVQLIDEDFVLDLWSRGGQSTAQREGRR